MEKYKVLLIDDEPIITQGLQILIDWEACGCEIAGCASDGLEGLELIRNLHPDIVISDIRMPNCSGIDMIRQALAIHPCRFIVLSGYSDFSYAKQCMSLGVQEYLLKPVAESELIQALEKIKEQLDSQKKTQSALTQLEDVSQQLSALALDDVLRDIMNSYFETEEDFQISLSDYDISLSIGHTYLAAAFQSAAQGINLQLRQELLEDLGTLGIPFLLYYHGSNTYLGIFSLPLDTPPQIFTEKLSELHQKVTGQTGDGLCIGIGRPCPCANHLPVSCKQALFALSYKIIRGASSVNPFDSSLKNAHFIQTLPDGLWDAYRQSLTQSNFASITSAIHKVFHYLSEVTDTPLLGIQINALNLLMTCIQYMTESEAAPDPDAYGNVDFMQQISAISTAEELEKYVQNIVYSLINRSRDNELAKPSELITQVENYINSNYLEDLSLMTVAQMFYISPIYLSQAFKKQTGQLYLDYVTQVKINAAKKLLLTTDLMVYEIAERLHYKDNKYFSRLFEKKTGKKPSEFRKCPDF